MTSPASSPLDTTRASYDIAAESYTEFARNELDDKPYDRAMLGVFAEVVQDSGGGPVGDLGCGPGRVAAYLAGLGLDTFGIDLSPGMIAAARREHPTLRFDVGSMTALDIEDEALSGALSWYSTVHTPPHELPAVFAELHRVLAPGGHLLLAYKAGDGHVHLDHAYGHDLSLDVYRFPPDEIARLLGDAGFTEVARLVREADAREKTPQGFHLVRRRTPARA